MTMIKIWRPILFVSGLCLSDALIAASCDYSVRNEWDTGFTADFTITNNTTEAIDGWSVSWTYANGSTVDSAWNTVLSGSGPYTATNLSWNGSIAPGASASFGMNGTKGASGAAEIPELGGICDVHVNLPPVAAFTTSVSSGTVPFDVTFDASTSSDPEGAALNYRWDFGGGDVDTGAIVTRTYSTAGSYPVSLVANDGVLDSTPVSTTITAEDIPSNALYVLDPTNSSLFFISAKKSHVVETHTFTTLSGDINDAGVATLTINLDSIESNIAIRNERMRNLLFETATFPEAIVTLDVDTDALANQSVGSAVSQSVSASLDLHGFINTVTADLIVTKVSATELLVQNTSPILLKSGDYGLDIGIEALREIAGLNVIGYTVPINFTLLYSTP